MFWHNFKYSFKILLGDKNLVFWALLWPLVLATLFYFAFSNFLNAEKLEVVPIGVVDNAEFAENVYLAETIKTLSDSENEDRVFDVRYAESESELDQLLEEKSIDGYLIVKDGKTNIAVKENGINQTILKSVVEEVGGYKNLVEGATKAKVMADIEAGKIPEPSKIAGEIVEKLSADQEYLNNVSSQNMDIMMIEYYTVIAMACLYSCLISSGLVKNYLANVDKKGARVTMSSIKRSTLLGSGLLASAIIQAVGITVLLLYMTLVLGVDFGGNTAGVVLLVSVASLAGLSFGTAVGALNLKSDGLRLAIMNVTVMLGCFFAGMMGVAEKYTIDTTMPLLNRINPSNMVTDGFYALYYYDNLDRFYLNVISLAVFGVIFLVISINLMRRKKYDSI